MAQLQGPGDLAWYAAYALAQRAAVIPPGVLAGQPDTVALAVPVPAAFVIEPLIETDGCGPQSWHVTAVSVLNLTSRAPNFLAYASWKSLDVAGACFSVQEDDVLLQQVTARLTHTNPLI